MTQPTAQNTERPAQAVSSRRSRSWWLNLGVALAVLVGFHLWQTRHVPRGTAPEFTALAISSQASATMSLAQWRAAHPGRPVALHFWAEWCGICRMEEDNVTRVAQDWPVLSVAMRSGDVAAVRRVMGQRGHRAQAIAARHVAVWVDHGGPVQPALVVIAPNGQISTTSVGYTTTWGMRARLWWAQWRA